MIRYFLDGCGQNQAAAWQHPALTRLRGRGPWAISEHGGGVMLQRGTSATWSDVHKGLDGLEYQLADPLPPLMQSITINDRGNIAWVDVNGHRLPVKLAAYAPVAIGLDGTPDGPCDEYGRLAASLWDRTGAEEVKVADPQMVAFARMALMSQTNLTAELCHAYGLITTDSIPAIFDAANGVGKATADGG